MPKLCAFGCVPIGVPMHRFPHAARFPERLKAWVHLVGGKLETPSDYAYYRTKVVCDIHFTARDRNRNNRLNALAIPSLCLPGTSTLTPDISLISSSSQPSDLQATNTGASGCFISEPRLVDVCEPSTSYHANTESRMSIALYYTPGSAPCRLVLLVAAALNIQLDLNLMNLRGGDQFKPDFLKLNPQHTVPTIVDGDFSLWESRTIAKYLVNKYGEDSSLYPTEPRARALVDQRLDFDLGTLYPRFSQYFYPQVFGGAKADEALYKKLEEALVFLNTFLEGHTYAAGDQLTLADLGLVATVSTIETAGISLDNYANIQKWFELVKTTAPGYNEANEPGIQAFKEMLAQLKAKTEL